MTGPFSERTVDAVAACLRTLSGASDADAMLRLADAATLGALRAFADRVALRQRYHDPALHQQHLPADKPAAALFNALEHARLDVLGTRWLPGVGKNLLAHPGAEDDGVRWLAFEVLSGRQMPREKVHIAAVVRAPLPATLLEELTRLKIDVDDQPRFAAGAARWVRAAAPHVPATTLPAASERFALPPRRVELRERRRRGDAGATTAPLKQPTAVHESGDASTSTDGVATAVTVDRLAYRAYTTAYDRIVNAAAVAGRDELVQLRVKLEKELNALRPVVARLAKRLLRVLMARQTRHWRFDLDEGLLDGSRLAAVVASGGRARPFKQEVDSPFPSTVVTLLIDHSGSMRGRPMQIAALTVEIFARVLERCGVKCEVLGFTTREWDGGEPAREWAANGYPANPGRLNALEQIVIKSADVPWRRARVGLGLLLRDEMLKENIDGEALGWAHARLLARAEERRILVVVSDGTPMDEATLAANGFEYLDRHLAAMVAEIESRSPVQLAAIGIGHDVSHVYRNATKIARIDDLGPALGAKLMTLLDADPVSRSHRPRDGRRAIRPAVHVSRA